MSAPSFMFYFFEAVAAISAISIIFIRNVFYAALLLVVCLLAIAGIYVLTFAEFLAVAQLMIYAGGILVVIVFGIMLTTKISGKPLQVGNQHVLSASLVGIFFLSLFIRLFASESFQVTSNAALGIQNTYQQIGVLLMSDYVLPFEIAGILLLVALIGASVTASLKQKS